MVQFIAPSFEMCLMVISRIMTSKLQRDAAQASD